MTCPKCGASNAAASTDCSACGIVFARWRPREAKPPAPPPAPSVESSVLSRVTFDRRPLGLVAAAVVVLGLLWAFASDDTEDRRDDPPSAEASRAGGRASESGNGLAPMPDGLNVVEIRKLIETCDFFQERLITTFPKSVSSNLVNLQESFHPGLVLAANMGILEFDPPLDVGAAARHLSNPSNPGRESTVSLGPKAAGLPIFDRGTVYEMELGRRRVEKIQGIQVLGEVVNVGYRWTIEVPALLYFAPKHQEIWGGAELRRTATGWKATKVWRNTSSSALILCGKV